MSAAIVVLGAAGQVGRSLVEGAAARGQAVQGLTRADCDVTDAAAVARAVEGAGLVVNCTAYTAVDRAESEPEAAFAANAEAPRLIARACRARRIPFVHISTDYVFDGAGQRPWREDDPVAPLNVYGRSKLLGEEAVQAETPEHVILRTGWVFSPYGANFVKAMRRLAAARPELRVVDDQHGGPTAAADIADAILAIAAAIAEGRGVWGIFHFGGAPEMTWQGFAKAILADRPSVAVHPIPSRDYPTPAARPRYSVLDCSRIAGAYGLTPPDWRPALREVLARLAEEEAAGC